MIDVDFYWCAMDPACSQVAVILGSFPGDVKENVYVIKIHLF